MSSFCRAVAPSSCLLGLEGAVMCEGLDRHELIPMCTRMDFDLEVHTEAPGW
jgi:hypothetical protein